MSTKQTISHTTTFTLNLTPAAQRPRARYPITPRPSKPFYLNDKTPYTPYTTSSYNPYLTATSPRTHRDPSQPHYPIPRSNLALQQTDLSPPRQSCSPYISPSNPFSRAYAISSPSIATPPIDLHKRLREVSGWVEEVDIWAGVVRVVFWAALVVFLSALFGFGYEPRGEVIELGKGANESRIDVGWGGVSENWIGAATRSEKGDKGDSIEDIWKGVEVSAQPVWRFEKPLEGIWEGSRSITQ